MMRRLLSVGLLVGAACAFAAGAPAGSGIGPKQLADHGWDCFQPPPEFNPYIHCAPPGQLAMIVSGEAISGMFKVFATTDVGSESAPYVGTERMIRADHFHGQPCPTDPPGPASGGTRKNSSQYEWSWLYPRFQWDYYICHTFDSPW